MSYLRKTPALLRWSYPRRLWRMPPSEDHPRIYLSFDDGPIPEVTPWVLDQLAAYQAKASFFCIGENIDKHPEIFTRLQASPHRVANHGYHHLNGWRSSLPDYIADVERCAQKVERGLFRPPYGKLRHRQGKALRRLGHQIVMWDVLSGDWDAKNSPAQVFDNLRGARDGSIIVFHDSLKAWPRLQVVLPQALAHFQAQGYRFEAL